MISLVDLIRSLHDNCLAVLNVSFNMYSICLFVNLCTLFVLFFFFHLSIMGCLNDLIVLWLL